VSRRATSLPIVTISQHENLACGGVLVGAGDVVLTGGKLGRCGGTPTAAIWLVLLSEDRAGAVQIDIPFFCNIKRMILLIF